MAKAVIIPKFGFTLEETEIVQWLVNEGDHVDEGDAILEVTTDKVNMEVDAAMSGILAGIRAKEGDMVPVTATVAWILEEGEALPPEANAPLAPAGSTVAQTTTAPVVTEPDATKTPKVAPKAEPKVIMPAQPVFPSAASPVAARMALAHGIDVGALVGSGPGGRITRADVEATLASSAQDDATGFDQTKVRATPAARRIALEKAIDLRLVGGSGPNGRVQEADAHAFALSPAQSPTITTTPAPQLSLAGSLTQPTGVTAVPFDNMRRTIARRLQQSMQEAPHIFFEADVEIAGLQRLCDQGNDLRQEDEPKINLTAALTKAVAWALKRHSRLNAHLGDDELLLFDDVNIGIAVALENGLIVPVVHGVDSMGIRQIGQEIRGLAQEARENRLKPADLSNGTFSISNLGMYGIKRFTAIINPPQVAILAVGTTRTVVTLDEAGKPVGTPMMSLTLSVDHRAVDGADAARFMADLKRVVENPVLMSL